MKVFISYNSKNGVFAELVKMKLEEKGIQVWISTHKIRVGKEWREEIDKGLKNCDVVVVLLNKISTKSPYVTYEWAFALGKGKTVIPVLTEECEIHPRLEAVHYIDFQGNIKPWEKLIATIKEDNTAHDTIKVGDLTVEDLEKLISGSKNIASESAKNEGRAIQENDIAAVANMIVNAKSNFETLRFKDNTILWVDDRPENNVYERQSLEVIGFKFDLAKTTKEALKKLESNKYVAIISDMGRVEGPREGYVLLKEVRKTNKTIPFFIYSSSNLLEHKIEAQEKGAQGSTNTATELIDLITAHVQPNK